MTTADTGNKFIIGPVGPDKKSPVPRRRDDKGSAYVPRTKIYPKLGHGQFRNIKWAVMAVTLSIYYLLPWIRWERGPGLASQAILFDFANQRLLFGPVEIWAQEFYYVTGLLVLGALALFLVTSVAGRMWCGYACPQTVWTDLMIAVERFWQGDRNTHMRRDAGPWTFDKVWRKFATHASWIVIGAATGGAFVFYFRDAPTLAGEFANGTAPAVAYVFFALFTLTTYFLGGIAREQVCIYMCPWPRIQGAMLDRDSLFISYRDLRGEPRGPHKRGETWEGRGDCVDCTACVAVCPTGIDIRNGPQLECIQCGLCIDACNDIMAKVGRPYQLITYTTVNNLENATAGPRDGLRIVRPRTVLYSVLITLVGGLMLWSLLHRTDFEFSVSPDRNPFFVALTDGGLRNGYTIKIANKLEMTRRFKIEITGLKDVQPQFVGLDTADPIIDVSPADVRALRFYLTLSPAARSQLLGEATPVVLTVVDIETGHRSTLSTTFRGPDR